MGQVDKISIASSLLLTDKNIHQSEEISGSSSISETSLGGTPDVRIESVDSPSFLKSQATTRLAKPSD